MGQGKNYIILYYIGMEEIKYPNGIPFEELEGFNLFRVDPKFNLSPVDNFDPYELLEEHREILEAEKWKFLEEIPLHNIPEFAFSNFTFDQICKAQFSSFIQMDINHLFYRSWGGKEPDPRYELVRKLRNSMWHYGRRMPDWNTLVAAFERIPEFEFGNSDFHTTFDYTTGYNEYGTSKFIRYYLDGIFGYMVHYRGEHRLTIGFNISKNNKLLISQIQLVYGQGNRWLYKLPMNYFEYAIECIAETFPDFKLFLVEGNSLAARIRKSYGKRVADFTDKIFKHVANTYNQPLIGWIRVGKPFKKQHVGFYRIKRI